MKHTPKEKEQIRLLSGVDFLEALSEEELGEPQKLIYRMPNKDAFLWSYEGVIAPSSAAANHTIEWY